MTTDPENLKVLASVPNEIEAAAIVCALAEFDIMAQATGGYTSGFKVTAPGDVKVVVKQADLDRAKQALKEILKDQTEFDWSAVDVGEPDEPDAQTT
jgi:hypothetical protein